MPASTDYWYLDNPNNEYFIIITIYITVNIKLRNADYLAVPLLLFPALLFQHQNIQLAEV